MRGLSLWVEGRGMGVGVLVEEAYEEMMHYTLHWGYMEFGRDWA